METGSMQLTPEELALLAELRANASLRERVAKAAQKGVLAAQARAKREQAIAGAATCANALAHDSAKQVAEIREILAGAGIEIAGATVVFPLDSEEPKAFLRLPHGRQDSRGASFSTRSPNKTPRSWRLVPLPSVPSTIVEEWARRLAAYGQSIETARFRNRAEACAAVKAYGHQGLSITFRRYFSEGPEAWCDAEPNVLVSPATVVVGERACRKLRLAFLEGRLEKGKPIDSEELAKLRAEFVK